MVIVVDQGEELLHYADEKRESFAELHCYQWLFELKIRVVYSLRDDFWIMV